MKKLRSEKLRADFPFPISGQALWRLLKRDTRTKKEIGMTFGKKFPLPLT